MEQDALQPGLAIPVPDPRVDLDRIVITHRQHARQSGKSTLGGSTVFENDEGRSPVYFTEAPAVPTQSAASGGFFLEPVDVVSIELETLLDGVQLYSQSVAARAVHLKMWRFNSAFDVWNIFGEMCAKKDSPLHSH